MLSAQVVYLSKFFADSSRFEAPVTTVLPTLCEGGLLSFSWASLMALGWLDGALYDPVLGRKLPS